MPRYKFKNGRMIKTKTLREKIVLSAKVIGISTVISYLAFTGITSYKYMTETMSLKHEVKAKSIEIASLNKKSKINEDKIKELSGTIKVNEDKYALIEAIEKESKKVAASNIQLSTENEGLRKYIEIKTGTKITKVEKAKLEVTKYTNEEGWWKPGDPNWGTMASGKKTHDGAVAMPKSIPFGTEVIIDSGTSVASRGVSKTTKEDSKVYTALDRGSAIVEKKAGEETVYCMDIWTNNLSDANRWGRQRKEGWIFYND